MMHVCTRVQFLLFAIAVCVIGIATTSIPLHAFANQSNKKIEWELDPEAEHLYYYLLFTEAIANNDDTLILDSLYGLLRLEPSLPLFQDGATILLSRQKYEDSIEFTKKGLVHFPDDESLIGSLAEAYFYTNKVKESIALLEKYLHKHPDANFISQELIRIYLQTGEQDKALKLLAHHDETDLSPTLLFFKSKVLANTGNPASALGLLRSLTKKYPDYADAWIEQGIIEENLQNYTAAITSYTRALQLTPENAELCLRLTLMQLKAGQLPAAFATALRMPEKKKYGFEAALLFSTNNYPSEAEMLIQEAIKNGANPDEGAFFLSVVILDSTEDYEKALVPLNAVSSKSSFYVQIFQRKAQLLLQLNKEAEAYAIAKDLRTKNADKPELWGLEAFSLIRLKKSKEAEQVLTQSLELHPKNTDLLFALGSIQEEHGARVAALATMEKVIAIDPKHTNALNYIGYTLAEQKKDLKRALTLIQAALKEHPDSEHILDSLAWVYYQSESYALAWETIRKCIPASTEPVIWEHYGDIAIAMGKRAEAKKGYAKALELQHDTPGVIQSKLERLK